MEANPLTPEDLAAIRERESKATPGKWDTDEREHTEPCLPIRIRAWHRTVCIVDIDDAPVHDYNREQRANARFITAARTDIPRLLATVEALRAALSEIEKGRGPRSADPLTHADNIIANLQRIAREALAGAWRPEA